MPAAQHQCNLPCAIAVACVLLGPKRILCCMFDTGDQLALSLQGRQVCVMTNGQHHA